MPITNCMVNGIKLQVKVILPTDPHILSMSLM